MTTDQNDVNQQILEMTTDQDEVLKHKLSNYWEQSAALFLRDELEIFYFSNETSKNTNWRVGER